MVGRLLREPLVHFLVLGGLLFLLHARRAPDPGGDPTVIVLDRAALAGLRADHERRTGTPATAEDERAAIERFVDDEILYREALALGLDRGDVIVRRRLLQKMEFLLDARADVAEPTTADLRAVRDAHPERYREPARVDLQHVFIAGEPARDATRGRAREARAALAAGAAPRDLGDPFIRGRELRAQSRRDLARLFGPAFADAAMALPAGEWSEPIASAYGLHLVRIDARRPPRLRPVEEIEATLRLDWLEARREEVRREVLRALRDRYEIRIEEDEAGDRGPRKGQGFP